NKAPAAPAVESSPAQDSAGEINPGNLRDRLRGLGLDVQPGEPESKASVSLSYAAPDTTDSAASPPAPIAKEDGGWEAQADLDHSNSSTQTIASAQGVAAVQDAVPERAPETPLDPEDSWTERLRFLVEHGTASLRDGEAFMFSEETGEATLFQ